MRKNDGAAPTDMPKHTAPEQSDINVAHTFFFILAALFLFARSAAAASVLAEKLAAELGNAILPSSVPRALACGPSRNVRATA